MQFLFLNRFVDFCLLCARPPSQTPRLVSYNSQFSGVDAVEYNTQHLAFVPINLLLPSTDVYLVLF